jgi:hypothetical protein
MSKGNKETRKPKKEHAPNPPGLPAGLTPPSPTTMKPKRR